MNNKKQQRTIGAFVKIPLEDGYHTYARILKSRLAFYDSRTTENLKTDEIIKKPVLFVVVVHDYAITQGHWLKTGKKIPVKPELEQNQAMYTEDVLTGKYLIFENGEQREASKEEIKGLESYTVWTPEGIEKRLNDHYANRKNEFVDDMKAGKQISGMFERAIRRKKELQAEKELKK